MSHEKSTSEPKEIGGCSVLCGNPNLIKPIPVKPNTQVSKKGPFCNIQFCCCAIDHLIAAPVCLLQDSEGAEPKPLSLATLFGSHQPHLASKSSSAPPVSAPTSTGKVKRPPVARTLTYEDAVNAGRNTTTGNVSPTGSSDAGVRLLVGKDGGSVVAAMQYPPAAVPAQPPGQPQHCPAISKLMQGQRGVAGVGGVLQTLSESPENRLCDNGVPLDHHHHHHHHMHQHHEHHHHEHHPHQHQLQPDPIKRLLQTHPPPQLATSFTSAACCSNPPPQQQNPLLHSQPGRVDSASCSHLQAQHSQQIFYHLTKSQTETQNSHQTSCPAPGTG